MPRILPWLTQAAKNDARTSSSPAQAKRRKRERDSSPSDLVDADLNNVSPSSPRPRPQQNHRADRTPSTSPPPAPPSVDYMRPGYHADDIYMMVEDEFHQTAKDYTAHIHRDEYLRLRKLARSRGEKTLEALEHGTDGGRTEVSRALLAKKEREALGRRKRDALGAENEEDDEELPFMQDPQLAGLMTREKGEWLERELVGMAKAKSNTRAAAGFMESPHTAKRHRDALGEDSDVEVRVQKPENVAGIKASKAFEEVSDEDDSDDLDAAPAARSPPRKSGDERRARGNSHDELQANKPCRGESSGGSIFKRFAMPSKDPDSPRKDTRKGAPSPFVKIKDEDDFTPRPKPVRPTYKKAQIRQASQALSFHANTYGNSAPRKKSTESSNFGGPSPPEPGQSSTSPQKSRRGTQEVEAASAGYLAKRVADRARKEKEQRGRAKRVDDIPTFLF